MTNQATRTDAPRNLRRSRSELSPLSLRRRSNQIILFAMCATAASVAVAAMVHFALADISAGLRDVAESRVHEAIDRWRVWLITAAGICGLLACMTAWRSIGASSRAAALERSLGRMGRGDLRGSAAIGGHDEFGRQGEALEALRQRSNRLVETRLAAQGSDEAERKTDEVSAATTELAAARNQIAARQALVEMGEVSAGVALEIQTPLSFMNNFTQVSKELLAELAQTLATGGRSLDIETMTALNEIVTDIEGNMERLARHSHRANEVVARTLALARSDGEFQPADLNELVRFHAVLGCQGAKALDPGFGVRVVETYDPAVGEVSVAAESMARVVLNLVWNACDAMNERRRLVPNDDAYVPTLQSSTKRREDRVEIRIRDNGIGIPEHVLDKVLNPFFTTKPPEQGTGLGLSQSADTVRRHRGDLRIESKRGRGTTVTISLPGH